MPQAYRGRQPSAPMEAAEVVRLLDLFEDAGIAVWLDGGWGVDALLERQTREHDDLDLVAELDDAPRLIGVLKRAGYEVVAGGAPKSFVAVDAAGRQVDVHPVVFDDARGGGVYLMDDGQEWVYPSVGFAGEGRVGGRAVRCLSPEVQVLAHDGYELAEKDYRELDLLHERFGVAPRDWQRLTRPGFRVELSYPAVTPRGDAVERAEEEIEDHPVAGDFARVHLTSPDSGELYIELARFPGRTPQDEYRSHEPYLRQRFGADSVTALTETSLRGRPAWAYAFRWDEGERAVLLLEVDGDTYRVIYDPRSGLNAQVVATVAVAVTT